MEQTSDHTEDINWDPKSEITRAGTPNCAIQEEIKARSQDSAVILARETASGRHLEVQSIMVRR